MMRAGDIEDLKLWMNDFWAYQKKFYEVKNTDKYWSSLVDEGNKLIDRYPNYFATSAVMGFIGWRENQTKSGRNKDKYIVKAMIEKLQKKVKEMEAEERKQKEKEEEKAQMSFEDVWGKM